MGNESSQESQFEDTPEGWAGRIKRELAEAKKVLEPWHKQAEAAIAAYTDERNSSVSTNDFDTKWNIFTADTQTQEAILFGNPPRASVSRRFADAQDDVARVGAEIQERLLNEDIEGDDDTFAQAVEYASSERQLVGFGLDRVRYVMGETEVVAAKPAMVDPATGMERAPAVPETERRPNEKVETDWVHWRDCLWGPCRVWHETAYVAFGADMSPRQLEEKFGKEVAAKLPLIAKKDREGSRDGQVAQPWDRARVWEVWMREEKQVFWYVDGYPSVLQPAGVQVEANGGQMDPLGLTGFFPCPKPMVANVTTSKLVPKPDRELAKDLYEEINRLSSRITALQDAVRVVGAYDEATPALGQLLGKPSNTMVPVKGWALFSERGGIKGAVDWFPLEQVVNALTVLRDYRNEQVDALRQITGMSDIMRGASSDGADATATESRIKSRFGSVRMQRRQKELAKFATDLQRLRAEVMAKHFEPSTYMARCNMEKSPDAPLVEQAVQLLQSEFAKWRIEVSPETVSMTDFDALKQERTEVLAALGSFMNSVAPVAEAIPSSMPFLLELLQSQVAGLKGSSTMEGILDQAIAAAKQAQAQAAANPQQAPPDPKVEAQRMKMQGDQMKAQSDMQREQFKLQGDITKIQAETEAHAQQEQVQAEWNTREAAQKALITHSLKMQEPAKPAPGGAK